MSINIERNYIEAFPISNSRDIDDKLLTEKNITNIIKHICGRNSFIIGEVEEGSGENSKKYIEFILDGYYFKIEKPSDLTLYAYIEYTDNSKDTFKDLKTTTSAPTVSGISDLQLLSGGKIKEDNKIRLDTNLIKLPTITSIQCVWPESNS